MSLDPQQVGTHMKVDSWGIDMMPMRMIYQVGPVSQAHSKQSLTRSGVYLRRARWR